MVYNYITEAVMIEIVGYAAGILSAIALLPQVIKSWKTKSISDVSVGFTLVSMASLILTFIYGLGIKSYPLIFMTVIEIIMLLSVMLMIFLYNKKNKLKH